jgi:hypothetical protein
MGPLSAVAVAFFLVMFGLNETAEITVKATALGWIAIIAAAVVLIDAFWVNTGVRYAAWRQRTP